MYKQNQDYNLNNNQFFNNSYKAIDNNTDVRYSCSEIDNSTINKVQEFYNQFQSTKKYYCEYNTITMECPVKIKKLLSDIDKAEKNAVILLVVGIVLSVFVVGIPLLIYAIYKICTVGNKKKFDADKDRIIQETADRQQEIFNYIKSEYIKTNRVIPFNYASPYVVEKLITYMINGRADSIKEAINLYENDEQTKVYRQQLQDIRKFTLQTARASQITAASTTYLAVDRLLKNIF